MAKFWGDFLGLASKAVVLPFAVTKGIISVAKGDEFEEGYEDTYKACESTIDDIEEFGDDHNDTINKAAGNIAITVAGIVVGGKIMNKK